MKPFWLAGCLLFTLANITFAQVYSRAYGDSTKPAVVFLHGGPGYNAAGFEFSTAQALADRGYYVIVFDQRGCGRSPADTSLAAYTFANASADLLGVYDRYHLRKAVLIGHSWGGTLGIRFAKANPQRVSRLVLVGSPVAYQPLLRTILTNCRRIYTGQQSPQLPFLAMVEKMDTTSLQYASYAFMHAMSAGLYRPRQITDAASAIYARMRSLPDAKLLMQSTYPPVLGFYKNEHYTTLDLALDLRALTVPVFGLYGTDDGLFDAPHLARLRGLLSDNHFVVVEGASHNVFIDQQPAFLDTFERFVAAQ